MCERQGEVGFHKAVKVLLASGDKKASWWLCPISVDLVEVRRAFDRSRLGNLRKFRARGAACFSQNSDWGGGKPGRCTIKETGAAEWPVLAW